MDRIEDDAAAGLRACAIERAIVGARAACRAGSCRIARARTAAGRPAAAPGAARQSAGWKRMLQTTRTRRPRRSACAQKISDAVKTCRERLFDQHVGAGCQCRLRERQMGVVRRRHHDRVGLAGKRFFERARRRRRPASRAVSAARSGRASTIVTDASRAALAAWRRPIEPQPTTDAPLSWRANCPRNGSRALCHSQFRPGDRQSEGHLVTRTTVKIGDRLVGEGAPCFITYEAGPTHSGIESAKELVRHAAEAGADAVKFQIVDPDRLVADRKLPFSYDVLVDRASGRTETVTEPLYDILCRRTLNESEWRELKAYSDSLKLAFFCTVLFDDEIDFVVEDRVPLDQDRVRRPQPLSAAPQGGAHRPQHPARHRQRHARRDGDRGRHHPARGQREHHHPSLPVRLSGAAAKHQSARHHHAASRCSRIRSPIPTTRPAGTWTSPRSTLGASLVEKTITLDRTTRSVEHIMSLEPSRDARSSSRRSAISRPRWAVRGASCMRKRSRSARTSAARCI